MGIQALEGWFDYVSSGVKYVFSCLSSEHSETKFFLGYLVHIRAWGTINTHPLYLDIYTIVWLGPGLIRTPR